MDTTTKKTTDKFSPEVRSRAVRMVREHQGDHSSQWAAIALIAAKIGCTGEMLRNWAPQEGRDSGACPGAMWRCARRSGAFPRETSVSTGHERSGDN